jgi:L-ectoine synthase
MFARSPGDLQRDGLVKVDGQTGITSARYLTKQDGLGFSVTVATLPAGQSQDLCFTNHWETSLVLEGLGVLQERASGARHVLEPGVLYCVGPELGHEIKADTDLKVMGVLNPALNRDTRAGLPRIVVSSPGDLQVMGRAKRSASGNSDLLRYLLARDGMGFTISDCRITAGRRNRLWYRNHWEANLILDGLGSVEDLASGTVTALTPGVFYCVGPDDRHVVRTETPLHLLSIFNPPLAGDERHDNQGGYPPTGPVPPGPR